MNSRLPLSKKLARAFVLVTLITLVVGAVGFQRVASLNRRVVDLGETQLEALRQVMQTARMHDALRAVVFRSILAAQTGNADEMEASERALRQGSRSLRIALTELALIAERSKSHEVQRRIRELQPDLESFLEKATDIFKLALVANTADALQALPEFEARVRHLEFRLEHLREQVESAADRSVVEAAADSLRSRVVAGAAALLGLLAATFVSLVFTRSLAATERQLMDASRQAGMADVATSVLHNVGNALNSINVSVTLVADGIRDSRLGSLRKALDLLREHRTNLAPFLGEDPKGRRLPEFLDAVGVALGREHETYLNELESLRQNVDHIKQIVARQQAYAKVTGGAERLPAHELVEDALRMAPMGPRPGVEIVRQFEPVLPVLVDRHTALQILINLIDNAHHAMEGNADGKRLTLRVRRGPGSSVCIEVIDQGTGITRENLTRIFQPGFTTRKTGHGFGLHACANAAREMGGSLLASSEGPGRGATFTLELPLHEKAGTSFLAAPQAA